eukprot:TRINITY_DN9603_c0_g2_i1.p1 TRINITY_DN9603_c0_g2~~TRINITY_DN9603_c0_g2_i1.p1  ORF type:complete len:219 (-),score=34.91 TRINITY_DN9603_c0_g2_i1:98-754(-)
MCIRDRFMKKYKKVMRFLFSKYANCCYSQKVQNFEAFKQKSEVITLAEIIKMLNDHNIGSGMVIREEVATIMRLINLKHCRNELTNLTYAGFQECFVQLGIYLQKLSHLPLAESVKALLKQFESAAESKGESVVLYREPDISTLRDLELLRELNRLVQSDIDYPVPEGYKKITSKELVFEYSLKGSLEAALPEQTKICLLYTSPSPRDLSTSRMPSSA